MTGRPVDLVTLFRDAAAAHPDAIAVDTPDGAAITYQDLDRLSRRVRDRLVAVGVRPGDRVGVHLPKSIDTVACILGALRAGAAYVPVDATAPLARCAYILADCAVRAVWTGAASGAPLRDALDERSAGPVVLDLTGTGESVALPDRLDELDRNVAAPEVDDVTPEPDDLAYILYTSGSTGLPKGVMLTHGNARSFVDWCSDAFAPTHEDVFSSHAPFHFDLSILDLYVSLKHGARLVLIGEQLGKDPRRLAPLIAEKGITVWYSTPSILSLLANFGKLERHDYASLRLVLFAGEVFPIPQLQQLVDSWPRPRYVNLYGPTETNVCTSFATDRAGVQARTDPLPIGTPCPPNRCRVVDEDGEDVERGAEGELIVHGPNVMRGYWNLPDENDAAFLTDADGARWYRTGDIVVEGSDGYTYRGRRDRMVKRRGFRVELGEIEAGLSRHPVLLEVAVVAERDPRGTVLVRAFVAPVQGAEAPSIIDLKAFSSEHLTTYMIPDTFHVVDALPRTSTDKVDYQAILRQLENPAPATAAEGG